MAENRRGAKPGFDRISVRRGDTGMTQPLTLEQLRARAAALVEWLGV